jgi:hypothetical protein
MALKELLKERLIKKEERAPLHDSHEKIGGGGEGGGEVGRKPL